MFCNDEDPGKTTPESIEGLEARRHWNVSAVHYSKQDTATKQSMLLSHGEAYIDPSPPIEGDYKKNIVELL
jgi:hypothetical protein